MANEDIVFNNQGFVDNLNQILRFKQIEVTNFSLDSLNWMVFRGDPDDGMFNINPFFDLFKTNTSPLRDWESFFSVWKAHSGDSSNSLLTNFVKDYKKLVGFQGYTANGNGDWDIILEGIPALRSDTTPTDVDTAKVDAFFEQQFIRSFSHFLATYPYKTVGTPPNTFGAVSTASDFYGNWVKYMTQTAEIDDSTSASTDTGANDVDIAAYEQVYAAFFPLEPGETQEQASLRYQARLVDFFNEIQKETGAQNPDAGWFIPSQNFNKWFEDLQQEFRYQSSKTSVSVITTVSSDPANRLLVIDRILRLLLSITDTLQRLSATQAERLTFLTNWQRAYTNLIAELPQYSKGDGSVLGLNDDAAAKENRQTANTQFNSLLETLRSRRGLVQDAAKQMQTTINQTQDAANQQTQMATSLLQQLSTILSQIYR